ncbi:MAG TPA: amidohydrolase family protein, partial [Gaiellaceae bacterium]|nr:amidohydrolase family protein [Gaiellaceae bacterium]
MILENGVVRTMDPSVPVQRALAVAGELVAGGVGVHETALASPEVVDLGGRCVVPGFTDSHVHFPTWALALRQVRLEGTRSLEEALSRVREALPSVGEGRLLRGFGWRDADWDEAPTKEALDAVTGDIPAGLFAHDYHSLWLNSAALALAGDDLEVAGGVVERDDAGRPTGILREESAWQFRDRQLSVPDDEHVDAMRDGLRVAAARGVTGVHDKDGWLGAARFWQRLREQGALTLRVWQSLPHEHLDRLVEAGLPQGLGDPYLRIGYLKAF